MPEGRKAILVITPDMMSGAAQFVPGARLDRTNRGRMELAIATSIINGRPDALVVTNIRVNPNDPPDVLFEVDGHTHGIELTEVLPPNRLANDAVISRLKSNLLDSLRFDDSTKNKVITIALLDDYAARLTPSIRIAPLAAAIQIACAVLESSANQITYATLTSEQRQQLHSVTIQKCDLSKAPRVTSPQMPLIIFSAQLQRFYPDTDFDEMIAAAARPKLLHDLDVPCELLLWSDIGPF